MASELGKMGAVIEEREDGLVIQGGGLKGAEVDGYGDHRVVMALTVAGLVASGATIISTAEAVSITFPNFFELMKDVGAQIGDY
jgi:3-phosphoshikimate 1-carboxyvinyltransferase